ncbi:MAG: DegT/DnrJ/EryC1/StrS family aminotransferase [Armatimonadetes bacterium]|nr:DegT/DnrJ/EryC1/StrS family aminotransferase [Armatimonadota bacterium]
MPEGKSHEREVPVFVQTAVEIMPEDAWEQVGEEEARMVYEMALRNELSGGTPVVRQFEQEFRDTIGTQLCLTTCNGSAALYSTYFGVGVGPGDEVITPSYTWICTIGPALLLGARPVFCEIDPRTLVMDPADVERRITERTRAIVPVHLWGSVCDMDPIVEIGRKHGIRIIEDCSHAHGAEYRGKKVGSIGDVGAFSLQGSKALSAGEGGALVTDDEEIFNRACLIGQANRWGLDLPGDRYQELQPLGLGMKLRSHPLGIGVALVQLHKLDDLNASRGAFVAEVEEGVADLDCLEPLHVYPGAKRGGYYAFPLIYHPDRNGGVPTTEFLDRCKQAGLKCGDGWYPLLHQLPLFRDGFDVFTRNRGPLGEGYRRYRTGDLPITEDVRSRLVFPPILTKPKPGAAEAYVRMLKHAARREA